MQIARATGYPHNIHHELGQVVQLVRKESIGYRLTMTGLVTLLLTISLCFVPLAPMLALAPVTLLGLLAWLLLETVVLPNIRLTDQHLALLAEIGFNEREAGKALKAQLIRTGYLTYRELRYAQKQYDQDNAREYRLRGDGAQVYLAEAPMPQ